jgi:hypothetical protein
MKEVRFVTGDDELRFAKDGGLLDGRILKVI